MVNITHKSNTLRIAIATATVKVSKKSTIAAIEKKQVPKGDVLEFARAAGLLGLKKTSDTIPDCHPLPIEYTSITYRISGLKVTISVEVHTIYKTGVEVEAMHGAAVTALTIYDMLKPIDPAVEIQNIRLERKSGGKSDFAAANYKHIKAAVVVCSDTIFKGMGTDLSGKSIITSLKRYGIIDGHYRVIPDDFDLIQQQVKALSSEVQLLIFSGGTGLSPRDLTTEAVAPLIERKIEGVMETARRYGQDRNPYAMLSRGIAGTIGNCLVLTLPGSKAGAVEGMAALFPQILHVFDVLKGKRHDRLPSSAKVEDGHYL